MAWPLPFPRMGSLGQAQKGTYVAGFLLTVEMCLSSLLALCLQFLLIPGLLNPNSLDQPFSLFAFISIWGMEFYLALTSNPFTCAVNRRMLLPHKDNFILTPRTVDTVTIHGKPQQMRLKLRTLRWDSVLD